MREGRKEVHRLPHTQRQMIISVIMSSPVLFFSPSLLHSEEDSFRFLLMPTTRKATQIEWKGHVAWGEQLLRSYLLIDFLFLFFFFRWSPPPFMLSWRTKTIRVFEDCKKEKDRLRWWSSMVLKSIMHAQSCLLLTRENTVSREERTKDMGEEAGKKCTKSAGVETSLFFLHKSVSFVFYVSLLLCRCFLSCIR